MPTLCLSPRCPQPLNLAGATHCQACGQPLWLNQRYRCEAVLGEGGFGRTYLAVDEQMTPPGRCVVKQLVAGQSLRANGQAWNDYHRRFRLEAEQLAILGQHPQIPQLLAVVDNAQGQFLVQEYIPGPNFDQLADEQSPMNEAQIRSLLADLLPVLQFVHDHQVIHRDIKPANLIAQPAPNPVALVDFGASKYIYDEALLKKTGTVIGSAGYVAPEQALGKAVYASDIFSLGLTCLHLLTGLHPFDLYSVSEDAWDWQPLLRQSISPSLAQVLNRMVNRRLTERYSTAQEVMADLRWGGLSLDLGNNRRSSLKAASPKAVLKLANPKSTLATSTPTLAAKPQWEARFVLDGVGRVASSMAISPSGRAVAVAYYDGTVRLWDCTTGAPIDSLGKTLFGLGHRGAVTGVAFTLAGDALLSGGEDGQVIRWDLVNHGQRQRLPAEVWQVSALQCLPDGDTLAVGSGDGEILLLSLGQRHRPKRLIHHQDQVVALAVDRAGQMLVSGSRDRTLRLWALPSGRLSQTLTAPEAAITAVVCHPQDGRIVSGDAQGRLQVWQPPNADVGTLISLFPSPITALALSPNGQWLAVGTEDGHLALTDLQNQGQTTQLRHDWTVRAVAFTPDSRMVVSSGADETIRFWCRV